MLAVMQGTGNKAACIFFIAFYLFTVIVLMNLVIAFFLEIFQLNWDAKQAEFNQKIEARKQLLRERKRRAAKISEIELALRGTISPKDQQQEQQLQQPKSFAFNVMNRIFAADLRSAEDPQAINDLLQNL